MSSGGEWEKKEITHTWTWVCLRVDDDREIKTRSRCRFSHTKRISGEIIGFVITRTFREMKSQLWQSSFEERSNVSLQQNHKYETAHLYSWCISPFLLGYHTYDAHLGLPHSFLWCVLIWIHVLFKISESLWEAAGERRRCFGNNSCINITLTIK